MFGRKIELIEIEAPRKPQDLTSELRESVLTLSHHPGFTWLLQRFRYEKAVIERQLKESRHEDIREVDFLQSGIYWAEWFDREMRKLVHKEKALRPSYEPTAEEAEAFQAALDALEMVD